MLCNHPHLGKDRVLQRLLGSEPLVWVVLQQLPQKVQELALWRQALYVCVRQYMSLKLVRTAGGATLPGGVCV